MTKTKIAAAARADIGGAARMNADGAAGQGTLLDAPLVVELGDRGCVGLAGGLLAQLGANVVLVEPAAARTRDKWSNRAACAAGKRSIVIDRASAGDRATLAQLVAAADVVLLSTDSSPQDLEFWDGPRSERVVICDLTAFGHSGPLAGTALPEALVEALAGTIATTGPAAGAPVAAGFPVLDPLAAVFAASSVVAALRVARRLGAGQRIDVALFDVGVTSLVNFLALHTAGKPAARSGNRHPLYLPWGTYEAADGWVVVCAGTDEHWRRVCEVMGAPQLSADPRFATSSARLEHGDDLDEVISSWTSRRSKRECEERLHRAQIACGQIVTVGQLASEPNLAHRQSVRSHLDASTGERVLLPASPIRGIPVSGVSAARIPGRDADRHEILALVAQRAVRSARTVTGDAPLDSAPLAGIRVVEVGHYTTGPMAARLLGTLGADVVKVEPPGGDVTRRAAPLREDGLGYVFALNNTDKRGVALDLRLPDDREQLHQLLATADVLVENLKPGSLAKLGFDTQTLRSRHPHLVYCAVTGFGADSAYPGRAGLDTVIQGMSGIMSFTTIGGTPTKTGLSTSDLLGGEFAFLSVLAALELRDRTGEAIHLDLSMQDASVWSTHFEWSAPGKPRVEVVAASDGLVAIAAGGEWGMAGSATPARGASREEMVQALGKTRCAPVLTVCEVLAHPQVAARELTLLARSPDGDAWLVFAPPFKLLSTPARVRCALSRLGFSDAQASARGQWGTSSSSPGLRAPQPTSHTSGAPS